MSKNKFNSTKAKKRFVSNICPSCGICAIDAEPSFCFEKFYKNNPSKFLSTIRIRLNRIKKIANKYNPSIEDMKIPFKYVFCEAGFCPKCKRRNKDLKKCIKKFLKQKKSTIVEDAEPTVSIIMSDDDDFKAEVNKILENNN